MSARRSLAFAALLLSALVLPRDGSAQDDPARSLNPLASIDRATVKGFVEKPLFEPSRRPPAALAPLAEPPPVAVPPPPLRLIGIIEDSRSLSAIVHRGDTNATETLHTGDHIGAWTIEVMPATLRAASGGRAFEYAMFRGNLQQGPIPVAPGPAASDPR